jgi:hypothetical protein
MFGATKFGESVFTPQQQLIYICRNTIIKNWLLNPTGHEKSFVEVDLVQEHLNFWIKVRFINRNIPSH